MVMRNFVFFLMILLLSQCKLGQNSTGTSTAVRVSSDNAMVKPDVCKVNAKVIRLNDSGVYTLRVYQVLEMGFAFKQNLNDGDKIDLKSPIELPVGSTIDVVVTYVRDQAGGFYMLSSSAE